MTEPGAFESLIKRLPPDVGYLSRVVQGLLVHSEWLAAYGLDPRAYHSISRATLPVSERLAALLNKGRALDEAHVPAARAVGTCRDFALILCCFLRTLGRPARLRCGFASYFGDKWEDHWICQYWDSRTNQWLLADAQLDEVTRAACEVTFNPLDLQPEEFLTAGEAWRRCRAGTDSPDRFGNGTTKGLWFMAVDVVRDWYVVNNHETSAWDRWREATPGQRLVPVAELPALDAFARDPEQPISDLVPPWLTGATEATAYSSLGTG